MQNLDIITKTRELLGPKAEIITGSKLQPLLKGFRGKQGYAIAAVSPISTVQLYKLIALYKELNVGYTLQGANTALKGQGTPNGTPENPVVIIRTHNLKQYKVLDYPGSENFKIMLVQPGLSLKEAESILNDIGYDLPHKIGSHDLGNTFGASCANGCGGVRVDNRDGRSSMTQSGNMGVVALSADGIIYNGFIKNVHSGEELLNRIDQNNLTIDDIELPDIHEIDLFLKKLSVNKSYPIHNHRGDIIFAGDGGEGLQAIAYQMYLIRKKPTQVKTWGILFKNLSIKEKFYKEIIFTNNNISNLPILCESMNDNIVREIIKNGVGYLNAVLLAIAPKFIGKHTSALLKTRTRLIKVCPFLYISIESFVGKILSKMCTPKSLLTLNFTELLVIQAANRNNAQNSIQTFELNLQNFITQNSNFIEILTVKPDSFKERLLLQIRNVSAITTLTLSQQQKGKLFAFDDAIMPGQMLNQYCDLLQNKLEERFPRLVSKAYLYGHDLKQINHNDWIIKKNLTDAKIKEIHHLQHSLVESIGGIPHAEHGIGDYSDTDLNREGLVKLVAHRLLNDINGIANYGGGPERAFQKAQQDSTIVKDAITFTRQALDRELIRKTLLTWSDNNLTNLSEILNTNISLIDKV